MRYYTGCDVSLKTTFICIIDENGKIMKEGLVVTDSQAIIQFLAGYENGAIGIESGQLSISLCTSLRKDGLPVICVDARHMAAALADRINKNDQNDARGIAQMMRAGLYKEVYIKSIDVCQKKILLGSRRQLVESRKQLVSTMRGLLKIYGVVLGSSASKDFTSRVHQVLERFDDITAQSIGAILNNIDCLKESIIQLDKMLLAEAKQDESIQRWIKIPGVGAITAMTYQAAVDEHGRFTSAAAVGAYMGLTPRQYASGEIDRHGSISKMGPKECLTLLYEAGVSILTRCKEKSDLRSWGLKLLRKKGLKKAAVAVGRKLATIMHRMEIDQTEFHPNARIA